MSAKRPVDVSLLRTADAILGLPFRAAHLAWPDVPVLSAAELEYMAEPLDEIFGELGLDWLKYVKAEYLKFAWGLSIAVGSRVRACARLKAAERKAKMAKREGAVE